MTTARAKATPALIGVLVGIAVGLTVGLALRDRGGRHAGGPPITQTRVVGPFDGVELTGDVAVSVSLGRPQRVRVSAPAAVARRISTRVGGGVLRIGSTGSMRSEDAARVEVRAPSLHALTLTGNGLIVASGVHTDRLTVALDGSGVVRADGTAPRLDVTLGGSGDAQLEALAARDVHASLGGSGRISVTASRRLDATLPGTGLISYGGDPAAVHTSVTGSGTIVRGEP